MCFETRGFLAESYSHNTPKDFLQSQWQQGEKSVNYLIYRWVIAVFFAYCVAHSIVANIMLGHMHIYFIYLSHLNLWGTMFMTGLSAYLVTSYHYDLLQVESHMPQLLKLHWFLWNQSTAFSCTISLFYWSDRNETVPIDLNDILVHSTNSAILFIELLVVKHPPNFWNWLIFVPIECTFLVFTVIFQYSDGLEKDGHNYVYRVLDWKKDKIEAVFYFSLVLSSSIFFYLIGNLIHSAKHALYGHFSKVEKRDQ